VSQTGGELQHVDPGGALVPRSHEQAVGTWADLRPMASWVRRRRPVLLAALVLIAAQIVWLARFLRTMYFFRDDFVNMDLAIRSQFDWHYLTYIGSGHLMIAERAVIWLVERISFYNWTIAWLVTLILVAAADVAAFRLLRTLFGERPAILIPLMMFVLSPLSVAGLGWWTVALEVVPFELVAFMAVNAHVYYVRTGRKRHAVASVLWVVVSLLTFEKAIVLPIILLGITGAFFSGRSSWLAGTLAAMGRYWGVWLIYLGLGAGYLAVLLVALKSSTVQPAVPGSLSAVTTFTWGLVKDSLLPGVMGGPWQWYPLQDHWYALALAPPELRWLAVIVAIAVIGISIWLRKTAWRAWVLLAVWVVLADMLPVIVSRLNWYPVLRALDTRYVADALPMVAICAGLAFLPLAERAQGRTRPVTVGGRGGEVPDLARRKQVLRSIVTAYVAVFVVGAVISVQAYQSATTGQPAAAYIANASAAIQIAPRGTRVIATPVPPDIGYYAKTSEVVGAIEPGKFRWLASTSGTVNGLKIFGADGRLYPAWVSGVSSGHPAGRGCWRARFGQIVIGLFRSPPYLTTMMRIGYLWGPRRPGYVSVQYGKVATVLTLTHGLNSAFIPVQGVAKTIVVNGPDAGQVCIGDVEVGNLAPSHSGLAIPEPG
jgi:hypothetical protein